jgi:hypothetical protein
MDLKETYNNLYEILINEAIDIDRMPYNIENATLKLEYIKIAMQILKEYSKFA